LSSSILAAGAAKCDMDGTDDGMLPVTTCYISTNSHHKNLKVYILQNYETTVNMISLPKMHSNYYISHGYSDTMVQTAVCYHGYRRDDIR